MSTVIRKERAKRVGTVVKNGADKSVVVAITRKYKHPIYGKFVTKITKIMAHDHDNKYKLGDKVILQETRPLSKRKRWRVVQKMETKKQA